MLTVAYHWSWSSFLLLFSLSFVIVISCHCGSSLMSWRLVGCLVEGICGVSRQWSEHFCEIYSNTKTFRVGTRVSCFHGTCPKFWAPNLRPFRPTAVDLFILVAPNKQYVFFYTQWINRISSAHLWYKQVTSTKWEATATFDSNMAGWRICFRKVRLLLRPLVHIASESSENPKGCFLFPFSQARACRSSLAFAECCGTETCGRGLLGCSKHTTWS